MLGEAVALHLGQVETSPNTWRERERAPLVLAASGPRPHQERERERYTPIEPQHEQLVCVRIVRWMDGRMVLCYALCRFCARDERERERNQGDSE
jgi:hypothetical protein